MSHLTARQEEKVLRTYAERPSTTYVRERTGHSLATVKRVLARHGIEHKTMYARKVTDQQVRRAIRQQRKGRSVESLARGLGIRAAALARRMRAAGYDPSDQRRARGAAHHNWKGGRTRVGGYIKVAVASDSPYYEMADENGYVLEHRLVMAQALGRPLARTETVHHLNGRRADNRPENLQLRRGRHGNGIALRCAKCGSQDLIEIEL